MTNDPIPEIVELCAMLDNEMNGQRIAAHAKELMEAYHQRKLGECLDMEPLIQARIAKAVEEANKHCCETCGSRLYSGPPDCYYCGAPNCCQSCCRISTIQRLCNELLQLINQYERGGRA